MSKLEQINLWLKQHYLCVMAWFVVVLIALIVVMAGNNNELVGYFSFACSLSGILLAIVVIIHTWIDSADTRIVLTEVKSHLTDIRGDVGKTADKMTQILSEISFGEESEIDVDVKHTQQMEQILKSEFYPYNISKTRIFTLLCLYCVTKAAQDEQPFKLYDAMRKMYPEKEGIDINSYEFCAMGVLYSLEFLFSGIQYPKRSQELLIVTYIPEKFSQSVVEEIDRRIKMSPSEYKNQEILIHRKQRIDDYFYSLREKQDS